MRVQLFDMSWSLTPPSSENVLGETADKPNCSYVESVTIRLRAKSLRGGGTITLYCR